MFQKGIRDELSSNPTLVSGRRRGEERREPLVFVLHLVRMVSDNGVWKRRRETKAGQRFHR